MFLPNKHQPFIKLPQSLQKRLTYTLMLTSFLLACIASTISATMSFSESQRFQDKLLYHAAQIPFGHQRAIADRYPELKIKTVLRADLLPPAMKALTTPPVASAPEHIYVQYPYTLQIVPLDQYQDGYHYYQASNDITYRVYIQTNNKHERVAAMQPTNMRNRKAMIAAIYSGGPLLAFIPLLSFVIAYIIRRTLHPINKIARQLENRSEYDNTPIPTNHLPKEILAYTTAINHLLKRNAQTIENQQRFIADAAHELRTPMAALTLQAERLAQADLPEPIHKQIKELQKGIKRNRNLLEQLLTLARTQNNNVQNTETADVQKIFKQTLEVLLPLADLKGIDIGIADDTPAILNIAPTDLYIVVKNLADNAIRYAPRDSQIDLRCEVDADSIAVIVEDNGHGIPTEQREIVQSAFHRMLGTGEEGTGLGLAIVRSICNKYQATLLLKDAQHFECGLRAEIRFPKQ